MEKAQEKAQEKALAKALAMDKVQAVVQAVEKALVAVQAVDKALVEAQVVGKVLVMEKESPLTILNQRQKKKNQMKYLIGPNKLNIDLICFLNSYKMKTKIIKGG
jgi:hypothetical protein